MALSELNIDVTQVDDTPTALPGQRYLDGDGRAYRYVRYEMAESSPYQPQKGDVVSLKAAVDGGTQAVTVTADVSDATSIVAGVIVHAVPGDGQWFWAQVGGYAVLRAAIAGTPADGNALKQGSGDGAMTKLTAHTDIAYAVAFDATEKAVILDCYGS